MGQLKNFVTKLTPKQLVDFMIKSIEEPVVELEHSTIISISKILGFHKIIE